MVRWHHPLSGRGFEQISRDTEGSIGSQRVARDLETEQQHHESAHGEQILP